MSDTAYGKFYINEEGHARAELSIEIDPSGLIYHFLKTEIGGFVETCALYLNNLQSMMNDEEYEHEMTGNLFTITFDKMFIRIVNDYDEEEWAETSPQTIAAILKTWQELINSPELKR